jgi:acyl-CoA synthetase (NDP forming)
VTQSASGNDGLARLLEPDSVAIFGASLDPRKLGHR